MKKIELLKEELKVLAAEIRKENQEVKELQRAGKYAGNLQYGLLLKARKFRHKHIAYCLLRGRTYEQIEQHCREGNEPDQKLIMEIKNEYTEA